MTYYEILGIPTTATKSRILRAYGEKILECRSDPQKILSVRQAFDILSHKSSRAKYDAMLRKSPPGNAIPSIESIEYYVELHRLPWRGLPFYPVGVNLMKLLAELSSRVFMSAVGGVAGFFIAMWMYTDVVTSGATPSDVAEVPGIVKLQIILGVVVFFFYKEIILILKRIFGSVSDGY